MDKDLNKYKLYLKSIEWAQLRIDLFEFRGRRCEKCNSNKKLQVHHLNYDNIFNEEPEDLIILCGKCHLKIHRLHIKKPQKKQHHKKFKLLSLASKVALKKKNPKQYKKYLKRLKERDKQHSQAKKRF